MQTRLKRVLGRRFVKNLTAVFFGYPAHARGVVRGQALIVRGATVFLPVLLDPLDRKIPEFLGRTPAFEGALRHVFGVRLAMKDDNIAFRAPNGPDKIDREVEAEAFLEAEHPANRPVLAVDGLVVNEILLIAQRAQIFIGFVFELGIKMGLFTRDEPRNR